MTATDLFLYIRAGSIDRSDAFIYLALQERSMTSLSLANSLGVSERTVQRSLRRLYEASLVKKDRFTLAWSTTDMSISAQSIESDQSIEEETSPTDRNVTKTDLAARVAQVFHSPEDVGALAKAFALMPEADEGLIMEVADRIVNEIRYRRPHLDPIRKPIPYFIRSLYNALRVHKAIRKIGRDKPSVQVFSGPYTSIEVLKKSRAYEEDIRKPLDPSKVVTMCASLRASLRGCK